MRLKQNNRVGKWLVGEPREVCLPAFLRQFQMEEVRVL